MDRKKSISLVLPNQRSSISVSLIEPSIWPLMICGGDGDGDDDVGIHIVVSQITWSDPDDDEDDNELTSILN